MGRISIDTRQCEIKKIFSDDYVFTIPRYQRPYAWTTMEAETLLEDLLLAMGEGESNLEDVPPYFLGSIILTKGDKPNAEVIDGQQRLTTITILIAALRATLRSENARDLEPFLYERANVFVRTPDRYRLTLRERDAEFFQRYIQAENGLKNLKGLPLIELSESQRNIRDNALLFVERLKSLTERERIRLGEFLVTNCFVVVVSTADFDTSYRMFSVLNDRGRNLTYADILKANIIGNIPAAEQDEYANKWEEIEVLLGSSNFQDLLMLIRVLYSEARIRKNLLDEFQTHVYPTAHPVMTAQILIDALLQPYGHILHAINVAEYREGTPENRAEIVQLLRWLNKLAHKEWLPVTLQYWGRNRERPDMLLRFLRDLDRLSVGLLLLNKSQSRRAERYYQLQVAIKHKANLYASNSPLQLNDEEQRIIYRTLNGNLYTSLSASICKYILLRLDSLLSEGSASYNLPIISVEHVLPQKLLPDSDWATWFPKETQENYVHRLANLVLLSRQKNQDAANFSFAKKKEVYFSNRQGVSPFVLTSQVLHTQAWTPDVLARRQHELVSTLATYWRIKNVLLHVVKGA